MDDLSARAAAGLRDAGVTPGDVVAMISHNQPTSAVVVHTILRAGASVSPINPALTESEIAKQLRDSKAVAVISAQETSQKAADAARQVGVDLHFTIGDSNIGQSFAALYRTSPIEPLKLDAALTLVALPYSSGTTGASKGVMLTHRNIVANLEQLRVGWRTTDNDVFCGALPFFHIYGFTIILNSALLAGATIVTLPRFDLATYFRVVQEHKVTRGHVAPPVVLALAQAPEFSRYDLTSMRTAISGAAPLDEEAVARAEARTGVVIRQGYGMTEASPGTHFVYDEDFTTTPAGSVGRLLPATEARIVDVVTAVDVRPGERGELLVRGPQVMAGYFGNEAETAATITDGWLHTGDIATVEGENFYIVDRLKELIKYKGYQIAPAELEALLLTHPAIADAAVIGIAHPTGGEAPKAFVVTDGDLGADELMAWAAERLAPYKRIRAVQFVDTIPKSPAGKILRRILKDVEVA
ncbi:MAG: AMP-binding protein [Rhodococcus sp. (in: high G+C Gram-positive bacteria)]|uniref:AMP-binding protein n=1 Tax=Rhodococcus sp. TaxID=1831 RepID=UPI002ADC9D66|nr:AMP-binding protein [Rhodococcus sp. (in: high G+C Gram-positive bacteria)]